MEQEGIEPYLMYLSKQIYYTIRLYFFLYM